MYILASEMANPGNQHCANCIGTLSVPTVRCSRHLKRVETTAIVDVIVGDVTGAVVRPPSARCLRHGHVIQSTT